MKKQHLIDALKNFKDDDNLIIGDLTYVPNIRIVCGGKKYHMVYYCTKLPNHEGLCYCSCKNVEFIPEYY